MFGIMSNYEKLVVWQRSVTLAEKIYVITNNPGFKTDFGFRDQVRRSAISISSNIAEGDELDSDRQAIRHFYIAKGSAAELSTQLIIAGKVGYFLPGNEELIKECREISAMLMGLIKSRSGH